MSASHASPFLSPHSKPTHPPLHFPRPQLSILAWAVVLAKLLSLAAPWEEGSPLWSYLNEVLGHRAGDMLLEAEEVLVRLLP